MKTILCIDDEPRMLDLLTLYLEPLYLCRAMSSIQEALDF